MILQSIISLSAYTPPKIIACVLEFINIIFNFFLLMAYVTTENLSVQLRKFLCVL